MRRLWTIKINAGARAQGITYSKLIDQLTKANIKLDRKILSQLAQKHPNIFNSIVEEVTKEPVEAK